MTDHLKTFPGSLPDHIGRHSHRLGEMKCHCRLQSGQCRHCPERRAGKFSLQAQTLQQEHNYSAQSCSGLSANRNEPQQRNSPTGEHRSETHTDTIHAWIFIRKTHIKLDQTQQKKPTHYTKPFKLSGSSQCCRYVAALAP